MQLTNVSDEVVRDDLSRQDQQSILTLATKSVPDVSKIMAAPNALVDPTLQKEMIFYEELVSTSCRYRSYFHTLSDEEAEEKSK